MSEAEKLDNILSDSVKDFFRKAGSEGGKKTAKRGKEYYAEIGRKGGLKRAENKAKKLSTDDSE